MFECLLYEVMHVLPIEAHRLGSNCNWLSETDRLHRVLVSGPSAGPQLHERKAIKLPVECLKLPFI